MNTKILVLEDEPTFREIIAHIFKRNNFEVIQAENGRVGIELAKKHLPDLIVSDVMMPECTGLEVLSILRKDERTAAIPFIFLTGQAEPADRRLGMNLGADDYLTKPFTEAELLDAVRSRLERQNVFNHRLGVLQLNITNAMPHEFRTPLTIIMAFSELLANAKTPPSPAMVTEFATSIYENSVRLHRLIENYLFFSKISLQTIAAEELTDFQNTPLSGPVSVITSIAQMKAQEYHRTRDLELDLHNADVMISEVNFQKIVLEIIDNAFKFSKEGTVVLITAHEDGLFYIIQVTDLGRGLTEAQINGVAPYRQFGRELHEQQGVGLGLVIAKKLTELCQGELLIESIPDKKTVASIRLKIMPRPTAN